MDVISKGLRYKGKYVTEGKKIENVPKELAQRWFSTGVAEPYTEPAEKKEEKNEKLTFEELEQKDGGWYIFPDESKAHGKKEAENELKKWNELKEWNEG
jgi:hypothetical protein